MGSPKAGKRKGSGKRQKKKTSKCGSTSDLVNTVLKPLMKAKRSSIGSELSSSRFTTPPPPDLSDFRPVGMEEVFARAFREMCSVMEPKFKRATLGLESLPSEVDEIDYALHGKFDDITVEKNVMPKKTRLFVYACCVRFSLNSLRRLYDYKRYGVSCFDCLKLEGMTEVARCLLDDRVTKHRDKAVQRRFDTLGMFYTEKMKAVKTWKNQWRNPNAWNDFKETLDKLKSQKDAVLDFVDFYFNKDVPVSVFDYVCQVGFYRYLLLAKEAWKKDWSSTLHVLVDDVEILSWSFAVKCQGCTLKPGVPYEEMSETDQRKARSHMEWSLDFLYVLCHFGEGMENTCKPRPMCFYHAVVEEACQSVRKLRYEQNCGGVVKEAEGGNIIKKWTEDAEVNELWSICEYNRVSKSVRKEIEERRKKVSE